MRGREVGDGQGQGGAGRGGGEPAEVVVMVVVVGGGGQVLLGEAHRTAAVAATTRNAKVISSDGRRWYSACGRAGAPCAPVGYGRVATVMQLQQ